MIPGTGPATAIDFELPDHDGRPWRLSEALSQGPVLLVFYRGDWWPYCNGQLASYARNWDSFERAGLRVAAICVDAVEQNRAMVDKLLLPFPVLSDPDAAVIEPWGVLNAAEKGIAKPSLFLVLPDRSVAFHYIGEDFTDRPTDEELFEGAKAAGGAGGTR